MSWDRLKSNMSVFEGQVDNINVNKILLGEEYEIQCSNKLLKIKPLQRLRKLSIGDKLIYVDYLSKSKYDRKIFSPSVIYNLTKRRYVTGSIFYDMTMMLVAVCFGYAIFNRINFLIDIVGGFFILYLPFLLKSNVKSRSLIKTYIKQRDY
ncbi:hypothetical protein IB633_09960 [Francisella philomiragia]|uniref:Uncharacterized protein n=1 Tax=Francisella philomiragia subsp. philomiragia (strain ATCC 25017 / CCUG 19701 / FSC 153 / O\|nr:hypothetical protein [Francisella philomiragia]AJI46633.1 hypothetical protein BF30_817 [Francisella philomiragia]AJI49971.1 hypothetical protein KU46_737 [Francisella philomiragia]MBK2021440.1 hypothetical protein [Francisella philomiragia]MBK2031367.1 hypothetical protein [Francisella philomiragia]MBK2264720.1 hypothetical protein [Francisella philomiragia]